MSVSAYRDTNQRVSQLASSIQRALRSVGSGWVEGEVQKLRRSGSGHVYFSLADADATIECCVWRSTAARVREWPSEGSLVQAHYEKADFYARSGRISLHVDGLRLTGEGELLARKQAVLDRLSADGLVARARRQLPAFPRRVGVIAARDSDAKVDVIKALRERWPSVNVVYRPALVEGVHAVDSVIEALGHLQDIDGIDVIVLARGGGGVRDLVAFDDERLCRAVFACAVPVVTSIGHTAQRPNCDHVAAAYADVPARAAELVVPSVEELSAELERVRLRLGRLPDDLGRLQADLVSVCARANPARALERRVVELAALWARLEQRLRRLPTDHELALVSARLGSALSHARRRGGDYGRALDRLGEQAAGSFARRLREHTRVIEDATAALGAAAHRRARSTRQSLEHLAELVHARDFRHSGWILAGDGAGRPVRSAAGLAQRAELHLHFHDGAVRASVVHVHEQEGGTDG